MAYPGVIIEIDEKTNTYWVTHTDGNHYPFELDKHNNNRPTRFEQFPLNDVFYDHDNLEYENFKLCQQQGLK